MINYNKTLAIILKPTILYYNRLNNDNTVIYMEVLKEMKKHEKVTCPECGTNVSVKSYTLECDYCLSKKED